MGQPRQQAAPNFCTFPCFFLITSPAGVVAAILGTETRSGDFEVADVVFAGLPPTEPSAIKRDDDVTMDEDGREQWAALVSGLEIENSAASLAAAPPTNAAPQAHGKAPSAADASNGTPLMGYSMAELRLTLLTEWLTGFVGNTGVSSRISSLVIAGNSIAQEQKADTETPALGPGKSTPQTPAPADSFPTSALDDFVADLTSTMHVHLLPGSYDPTSMSLPQQPLHFALLPRSATYNSLHRETNPAWFAAGGKRFLGTSGQNIDNIFKYLYEPHEDARLDMACRSLDWGHVCPTAPDTLSCYPLNDRDPFLVEAAPDVYFIGNQDRFATREYQDSTTGHTVRVVLVPRFAQRGEVVLVNLASLECKLVEVGIGSFA